MLLTAMEASGGASAPDVQEAPQRRRVCILRRGAPATHDHAVVQSADRIVELRDGAIISIAPLAG